MKPTTIAFEFAATALAFIVASAHAHDVPLDNGQIKPRIGHISDEVARQRLITAGLDRPEITSRKGERITLRAVRNGQPVTLHMNSLSGTVSDEQDPKMTLTKMLGPQRHLMVRSGQPSREEIANTPLMPRPTAAPR